MQLTSEHKISIYAFMAGIVSLVLQYFSIRLIENRSSQVLIALSILVLILFSVMAIIFAIHAIKNFWNSQRYWIIPAIFGIVLVIVSAAIIIMKIAASVKIAASY